MSVVQFADRGKYLATNTDLRRWTTKELAQEACSRVAANLTRGQWSAYLGAEPPRACGQLAAPALSDTAQGAPDGGWSEKSDAKRALVR